MTDGGIVMLTIPLPENDPSMLVSDDGLVNVTVESELHPENASCPMLLTEDGIDIDVSELHPRG